VVEVEAREAFYRSHARARSRSYLAVTWPKLSFSISPQTEVGGWDSRKLAGRALEVALSKLRSCLEKPEPSPRPPYAGREDPLSQIEEQLRVDHSDVNLWIEVETARLSPGSRLGPYVSKINSFGTSQSGRWLQSSMDGPKQSDRAEILIEFRSARQL
jgi:hypothetical protein